MEGRTVVETAGRHTGRHTGDRPLTYANIARAIERAYDEHPFGLAPNICTSNKRTSNTCTRTNVRLVEKPKGLFFL
jgi:hypothetical protein